MIKSAITKILITAVWLLLTAAAPICIAETPQQLVQMAEQAFNRSDITGAMALYRQAAQAGYAPAQSRLAYLLDLSEENEEAIKWYRLAAAQNRAEAQFELARLYTTGEGVEQDKQHALKLFMQAAENEYEPAIRMLALANEHGQLGLRIDYEQARQWLELGKQLNDHWSINRLARAYREGDLGLRIDRRKARQLEDLLTEMNARGINQ